MIVINDKYAITSDVHQWILNKRGKATEKNKTGLIPFKFCPNLPQLIQALEGLLLRESDYDSFSQLSSNASEIRRLLERKIKVSL